MKTIDQTWRVGRKVPRHIYRADDDSVVGMLDREEDARLASAAPEGFRMLLDLETVDDRGDNVCAFCGAGGPGRFGEVQVIDHLDGCRWLALMRKAGVR